MKIKKLTLSTIFIAAFAMICLSGQVAFAITPAIEDQSLGPIDENFAGSVGTPTASGDIETWSIEGGNTDVDGDTNDAFAIDSGTGEITVNDSGDLDREQIASFSLTVQVYHSTEGSDTGIVTINLTDVNDVTPVITPAGPFTIAENSANGTSVGTVSATDGDVTPTTFQDWTITGGTGSTAFAIGAATGQITVADVAQLDYEITTSFTLTLKVKDTGGTHTSAPQTVTINLTDVNEAPTNITLSKEDINENMASGTIVGTMSTTDPDPGDTHTYTFAGGADDASFTINGADLKTAAIFNYEAKNSYSIKIRTTDSGTGPLYYDKTFTITINDINEAPVGVDDTATVVEDLSVTIDVLFNDSDVDLDTLSVASVDITTWGTLGTVTNNGTNISYTADAFDFLYKDETWEDEFAYTVSDGDGLTATAKVTVTVTGVNDAPIVALIPDQTILEGATFATINLDNYVGDVDNSDSQMTWTYSGNSALTVSINASRVATITIPNLDWNGSETITFRATDPGGLWSEDAAVFKVTAVNDMPVFTKGGNQTVDEDAGAQTVVGWATGISAGPANEAGQTLTFNVSNNNNSLFSAQPTIAVNGTLTYTSAVNANGSATVTVTLTDDATAGGLALTTAAQTFTITINPVNDIPVAQFSATPTLGIQPLTVQFTDLSTDVEAGIDSYLWDFGDGGTSSLKNPTHTYTLSGPYTVSLTVTDSGLAADDEIKISYINVKGAPVIAVNKTDIRYEINYADRGAGSPAATNFTITNNNAGTIAPVNLDYTVTNTSSGWLICSTSGSLAPGASTPPINVTFNTTGLTPNTYEAYIVISDPKALNTPVKIYVRVGIIGKLDMNVAGNNDDAEEESTGDMRLGDSVLDLGSNKVGIRFTGVNIPPGSEIKSAYIEFDAYDNRDTSTGLNIYGQYIGNAPIFSTTWKDISNRAKTAVSVPWSPGAWNSTGFYQTPNLKALIQNMINNPAWNSGNALAFIFEGSGRRTAVSYDGSQGSSQWVWWPYPHLEYTPGIGTAPRLYVEYLPGAFSIIETDKTSLDLWVWQGDSAAPGSFTIKNAGSGEIRYTITDVNSGTPDWINCTPASGGPLIKADGPQTITVNYNTAVLTAADPYTDYTGTITISDPEASNSPVTISVSLRVVKNKPLIEVDTSYFGVTGYEGYDAFAKTFTLSNTGRDVLNYVITDDANAGGVDWLSCSSTGGTLAIAASKSIKITFNSDTLAIGTYSANITISDPNAINTPMVIEVSLTVEGIPLSTACGDVPVYTENLVSPAIMLLLDCSGSMAWNIIVSAVKYQTPDIKTIVQEIVNRSGWSSGNNMAFVITGSGGYRRAMSFDYALTYAPILHVEYAGGGPVDIQIIASADDAKENSSYSVVTDYDYLAMGGDTQYKYNGVRFQNVQIPKGATITNAYIIFYAYDNNNSTAASLIIKGHNVDNAPAFVATSKNIYNRYTSSPTTASVSWNNWPTWTRPTQQPRMQVARDALKELVTDKTISWGFGTWEGNFPSSTNYTKINVGCRYNTIEHLANLQAGITAANPGGNTPLTPALNAGLDYFEGDRPDLKYGETFKKVDCQPTFVIVITDGMGNTGTTVTNVGTSTAALAAFGVNTVGIGFGLSPSDTEQLYKLAEVSNDKGDDYDDDSLYALHEVVGGTPMPFLAQSKEDLVDALNSITSSIKAEVFHGSAPAPTTSVDYGDIVITAKFQPSDWSGDLVAAQYNAEIGGVEEDAIWSAVDKMPATINAFTVMSGATDAIPYTDSTLATDCYICSDKKLGDIIDSTPIIVEDPTYAYNFDNYLKGFKYVVDRDPMVYIGVNDGALHAFRLVDKVDENGVIVAHGGEEVWRFYPTALHNNLNKAGTDAHWNMCDEGTYCHRYFVDGSPVAADIYDGAEWKTMLACGLREGGEAYFALNITSGKAFDDSTDPSKFMWEFTDSELGQTWADPAINRVNTDGGGAAWGVFFGSGYRENQTAQTTKEAYLYGIEAHNKSSFWVDSADAPINRIKISDTTLKNDALSSAIVADIEGDYIGNFIYTGNLYGSLYRVKNIGKGMEPSVTKLFDSGNTSDHSTPIRAAADYGYAAEADKIWVYFGTGRYETQVDKYSSPQQYFFGLKDSASAATTYTMSDLTSIKAGYMTDDATDKTYRTLTLDEADYKGESWVIGLDNETAGLIGSERVISQPLVVGGIVFFTTFIPDIDVCAGSGTAWLFAVDMQTGMAPAEPIFDINADGVINDLDKITSGGDTYMAAGVPLGAGQPSKPVLLRDILFVTTTAGGLSDQIVNLDALLTKLRSWMEE